MLHFSQSGYMIPQPFTHTQFITIIGLRNRRGGGRGGGEVRNLVRERQRQAKGGTRGTDGKDRKMLKNSEN